MLVDWLTKSLFRPISHDVAMGGVVTEEKAINRAHYLDLVYSQYGMLYDLIPRAPCPSTDPAKPPAKTLVDGVVGSIQPSSTVKPTKQPNAH